MNRPLGVTLICVVNGILGILGLFAALTRPSPIGVVFAASSILALVAVYGLWTLRAWGWALVLLLYAVSVVAQLYAFARGGSASLIGIAVGTMILLYLYGDRRRFLSNDRRSSLSPR